MTLIDSDEHALELLLPLKKAFVRFGRMDLFLLHQNVNERSLTHRFAAHMQESFTVDFDIDCEYNRMGNVGDSKSLRRFDLVWAAVSDAINKELNLIPFDEKLFTKLVSDSGLTVYPDIIVHKRGDNSRNFLVIEAKKMHRPSATDSLKLTLFTTELEYRYGVFLGFGNGMTPASLQVWKNGACCASYEFDWKTERFYPDSHLDVMFGNSVDSGPNRFGD
jgi:hypothetical protein